MKEASCVCSRGSNPICWLENCHALWLLQGVKTWTSTHHVQKWVILDRAIQKDRWCPDPVWPGLGILWGQSMGSWPASQSWQLMPSFLLWKYQLISPSLPLSNPRKAGGAGWLKPARGSLGSCGLGLGRQWLGPMMWTSWCFLLENPMP